MSPMPAPAPMPKSFQSKPLEAVGCGSVLELPGRDRPLEDVGHPAQIRNRVQLVRRDCALDDVGRRRGKC